MVKHWCFRYWFQFLSYVSNDEIKENQTMVMEIRMAKIEKELIQSLDILYLYPMQ